MHLNSTGTYTFDAAERILRVFGKSIRKLHANLARLDEHQRRSELLSQIHTYCTNLVSLVFDD